MTKGQPLTRDDLKRMRRTPQVKIIRRALGLTQEEFAARTLIPVGTLRDWEQGRTEPDQPARAYLTVIARDPKAVRKAKGAGVASGDVTVDDPGRIFDDAIDVRGMSKRMREEDRNEVASPRGGERRNSKRSI